MIVMQAPAAVFIQPSKKHMSSHGSFFSKMPCEHFSTKLSVSLYQLKCPSYRSSSKAPMVESSKVCEDYAWVSIMGKTDPFLQCHLLFTGLLEVTQNLLWFSLFSIPKDKPNTVVFTPPDHPSLDSFIGLPVLTKFALLWDSQNVYLDSINLVILHHFHQISYHAEHITTFFYKMW